jgi:hypothetical protein
LHPWFRARLEATPGTPDLSGRQNSTYEVTSYLGQVNGMSKLLNITIDSGAKRPRQRLAVQLSLPAFTAE